MRDIRRLPTWPGRMGEDQAAAYLSVSKTTFRARVASAEYPQPVREGSRNFWARTQLDRLIDQQFGFSITSNIEDPTWADLR
jgi:hypothetical protein